MLTFLVTMVLSFDRWVGKIAILTGASVGIGANIAEQLVKKGVIVAGLARRSEKIEELAEQLTDEPGKLYAIKADMAVEEEILSAFEWVKENLGPVSILINNAGIIQPTELIDGDSAMWKKIMDVNVLSLCITTREAVKVMRENNIDGHIVHMNSIVGHQVFNVAGVNLYPASKHAVTAMAETLRFELNRIESRIKITSISPGIVATEIAETNSISEATEFGYCLKHMPQLLSEDVTDAVLYVLSTPPHVLVRELIIKPVGEKI